MANDETCALEALKVSWFQAACDGDEQALLQLLEQGLDIDVADEKQNTALHLAVKHQHVHLLRMLIAQGADLQAVNDWQSTPLHLTEKHVEMIQILLEAGANPNVKDKDWDYPYYFAFYGSMTPELTKLYIKHGAHLKFVENS